MYFDSPYGLVRIQNTKYGPNRKSTTLLLTEREGRTGEYWPEVVAVRTERSEVRAKAAEGQYSPVRLELAGLVSSLLYGTRAMLASNLPAFENKKYAAYDRFHGNGPYSEIPTKKGPIGTLRFAVLYNQRCYTTKRLTRYIHHKSEESTFTSL